MQRQQWRIEPEISEKRKKELTDLRNKKADIQDGIFPFSGQVLNRADVEWLLATHEDGRGPIDWSDLSQRDRAGLDLRGANLKGVDLSYLPLSGLIGGLRWREWHNATVEQREKAALHLEDAYLQETHFEGAILRSAHFLGANLRYAHFQSAHLRYAHFEEASLRHVDLTYANMGGAFFDDASQLEHAVFSNAREDCVILGSVHWNDVDLSGIDWSSVKILGDERIVYEDTRGNNGKTKDKIKLLSDLNDAVRAYRQLSVVLQSQGLTDEANRFAYRGQLLQKVVFWEKRHYAAYLFSWLLDLFAGYGYKSYRFIFATLAVLAIFWAIYFVLALLTAGHLTLMGALVLSVQNLLMPDFKSLGASLQDTFGAIEGLLGLFIAAILIAVVTNRILNK